MSEQQSNNKSSVSVQQTTSGNVQPAVADTKIYGDVTFGDLYREVQQCSVEDRALAVRLMQQIEGVLTNNGQSTPDIAMLVILQPLVTELLKLVNMSTDSKIKALGIAQKAVAPPKIGVMTKIGVGGNTGGGSALINPTAVVDNAASGLNIFKDKIADARQAEFEDVKEKKEEGDDSDPLSNIDIDQLHSVGYLKNRNTKQ